jgi:hypothetical protein
MQKNAVFVLIVGFVFGLGLASCATSESSRSVAGDSKPRYSKDSEDTATDRECYVGETRNERGECLRDRPVEFRGRKGGR